MFNWLKRLFGGKDEYNQFSSKEKKLRDLGLNSYSLWTEQGLNALERAKSKLDDESEAIVTELIIASHKQDNDKIKQIGKQLNDSGGIEKMKLFYYRAEHRGGDGRWIEVMWSGIGDWMG